MSVLEAAVMDKEDMRLIRVKLEMVRTLLQEVDQHTSSSQVGYFNELRSEGFSVWIESALFSTSRAHELILKQLYAMPEISRNESGSLTKDDGSLKILDTPIKDLKLSPRSRRCMKVLNVSTVGDLVKKTASELRSVKQFGARSLLEVEENLKEFGLRLSEHTSTFRI